MTPAWLIVWGLAALVSLGVGLKFRLFGPGALSRPGSPRRRWHPILYLALCIAALTLQLVGATLAAAAAVGTGLVEESPEVADVNPPAEATPGESATSPAPADQTEPPLTLRQTAIITAGSQVVAVLALLYGMHLLRQRLGPATDSQAAPGPPLPRSGEPPTRPPAPRPLRALGAGLLGLLLTMPVAQVAGMLGGWAQTALTGEPPEQISHTTLRQLADAAPQDFLWVVLLAGTVVLLVPIIEEFMYRLGLQGAIAAATGSRALGICATACLFALMHLEAVPYAALPPLAVLAIGFGVVYERTGSLAAAIVMHAGFNALNVAALLFI